MHSTDAIQHVGVCIAPWLHRGASADCNARVGTARQQRIWRARVQLLGSKPFYLLLALPLRNKQQAQLSLPGATCRHPRLRRFISSHEHHTVRAPASGGRCLCMPLHAHLMQHIAWSDRCGG